MAKERMQEILGILAKNGIEEFEHEENGKKLRIKCRTTIQPIKKSYLKQEKETKPIEEKVQEQIPKIPETYILKSIYVGYFFILRKKEDESIEPFVKIGDKIRLEDTLGILECMKGQVQHEIKLQDYKDFQADYGVIEKVLAENGMPVDYGKPLFEIRAVKE